MRIRNMVVIFIFMFLMVSGAPLYAAQTIRILPDVSGERAIFNTAGNPSGTMLSVQLPALGVRDVNLAGNNYKKIELPVSEFLMQGELSEEGRPDLPALTTDIIIPDQAGVTISISHSGYEDFPDFDLAPVQPSNIEGETTPIPFTIDNQAYSTDAFYPGELAEVSDPQIMRDVRFVQVALYPAQYNPAQRLLRVYNDLSVSISYDGEVINPKTTRHDFISEGFYPIYKTMFANFDQYLSTMEVKRGGYLIICKPALVDTVRAVARWKHQKGYSIRIVPTTEINSNGSPSYSQVFAYLDNAYTTWEIPPEYVMLVGDLDGTFMVDDYPYSSYPSDHEYSCVDGTDYLSDLFIARLSVDNMTQARVALSKILKYEKTPYMRDPSHWIRGLGVGYTYYETSRLIPLWVRQEMLENHFIQVDTVFGMSDDGRLQGLFNSGPGFIFYRGAGSTDGWWGPSFTISNLNSMPNNQKLGVLSPLTCGTGDFGGECFGETWIRMGLNPDSLKGGPAFFGVSDHNTHTKWNNPIMIGYFNGIFNEGVYHFAAAAVQGKLLNWRTFPRNRGNNGTVEQYFHTYNMLGDPELELRTKIPIYIRVDHPDTVAFGPNYMEIIVTDTLGEPAEAAFVTLIKGTSDTTEELYSLGKTDFEGRVVMPFNAQSAGPMTLTVSGRNLFPYQTRVEIISSAVALGLDSIVVDDDNHGSSSGNSNGNASSGEIIELDVWLKNFGSELPASGVTAVLENIDALTTVYNSECSYGNLAPGESLNAPTPFLIQINFGSSNGDLAQLKLTITDNASNSWISLLEIPITGAEFAVTNVVVPEGDSIMSPGETVNFRVTLANRGSEDAIGINATITTEDDYSRIISNSASFGDIPVDSSRNNSAFLFSITCDSSSYRGHQINLVLNTRAQNGARSAIPFKLPIGPISRNDPVGPDAYGYYMYDTKDSAYAMMPTYEWVEISPDSGGGGTRLNYGSNTDDKSLLITLPFNFYYYGQPHGSLIVSINGFVALDTVPYDQGGNYWANFYNWSIPDPGNARGQISPFWDDMWINGSHYGVYTWYDPANHKFYIEWLKMTHRNTSAFETFQMVITDPAYYPTLTGDSEIYFIYKDINNTDTGEAYSSVGFENWEQTSGLEFTYENYYAPGATTLADNVVIRVSTNTGRGGVRGAVDLEGDVSNEGVMVHAASGPRRYSSANGDYWIKNIQPGLVDIMAEMRGYFPQISAGVTILSDQNIELDSMHLAACPIPLNLAVTNNLVDRIVINWDPISHPDFEGYNLYRSRWENGEFLRLNSNPIQVTTYTDIAVFDTNLYWYCITAAYSGGDWSAESFKSEKESGRALAPSGTDEDVSIPIEFSLSQNYPNPFNPSTTISYGLPSNAYVKIEIFSLLGQKVITLVDEIQDAGFKQVTWNGNDGSGKTVTSGIYFYRLVAGDLTMSKKMLMLK